MASRIRIVPLSEYEIKAEDVTLRPAYSPAQLDTATWNANHARSILRGAEAFLKTVARRTLDGTLSPTEASSDWLTLFPSSIKVSQDVSFILARLRDGQRVLLAFSADPSKLQAQTQHFDGVLSDPYGSWYVALIPTDIANVRYFVENIATEFGPRPMGTTPRLGIGDRMTSLVFPGAFDTLEQLSLPCNIIQNSVGRELAPALELLSSKPLPQTYLPGLGNLTVGHTGSSIEGLWLEGVLWGIEMGVRVAPYGADADHVPVRRSKGSEGMDRAKLLIDCSRDYTFFTLDTSDLFDYSAGKLQGVELQRAFEALIPNAAQRRELIQRHTELFEAPAITSSGGYRYHPTEEQVVRFVIKYWHSLKAAGELNEYIASVRGERGYDFEFSMDERPLDISALESVTPDEEVIFVLRELEARNIRCTHVAPNFGVEKGVDYRLPDGVEGLANRSARMAAIARRFGVTLDYHSGDDLSRHTRQRIAEGTGGALDYKISPILQVLYAEVLADVDPARFRWWWETTRQITEREAARGEQAAQKYLKELAQREAEEGAKFQPRVDDHFFWNYSFAVVGARDEHGNQLYREKFYDVSPEVQTEIRRRTRDYCIQLAQDLGLA